MPAEFQTPWRDYGDTDMDRFSVENGTLYIPRDRSCAFIEAHDRDINAGIRLANEGELHDLWRNYRLIALLPVFRNMLAATLPNEGINQSNV